MGYAQIAVFAVLATTLFTFGGMVLRAKMNADQEVGRAERAHDELAEDRKDGGLRIDSWTYSSGPKRETLFVTNTGKTSYYTADLDVLLDGVWKTSDIAFIQISGSPTNIWTPGIQVEIRINNVNSNPFDAEVVTGDGTKAFIRR